MHQAFKMIEKNYLKFETSLQNHLIQLTTDFFFLMFGNRHAPYDITTLHLVSALTKSLVFRVFHHATVFFLAFLTTIVGLDGYSNVGFRVFVRVRFRKT